MKAALALALVCLLSANSVLGAGGLLNKYQPPRQGRRLSAVPRHSGIDAYTPSGGHAGRKLLSLIPGLASGSSSPSSGSGSNKTSGASGGGSKNSTGNLVLATTVAYGDNVVACKEWVPDTLTFDWPSNPTEFTAAGKEQPPAAAVQKLASLVCSDPEAAGKQIRTAVQAGGSGAQVAVYAIFAADCPDKGAASDAYGAAIDAVNNGDPTNIDAVSSWLANFAKAADEVGIPVCMSLAVIDTSTDEAVETRDFHATGSAPAASKPPRGGSSSSGTKAATGAKSGGGTGAKGSAGGR